jgi:hypothetical protein
MKISRYHKKIHDPWGSKFANLLGSPVCRQFDVGRSEYLPTPRVDDAHVHIDIMSILERTNRRFVRTGKHGIEKLRR